MFKKIVTLVLTLSLFSCTSEEKKDNNSIDTEKKNNIVVMAYYVAERPYNPESIPVEKLTHIIYSFTNVINGEMKFRREKSGEKLKQLVDQKRRNPELKVMIACGGWGADGFSDMALTEQSRGRFIKSAISFIEEYKLDGLDIDWEYPGRRAADTKYRPEDTENFTLLMKGLREAMDAVNPNLVLTFAAAGWKPYYNTIQLKEVMKHVDYINVMTYDQIGATTSFTGHHTALGWITEDDIANTPYGKYMESRREELAKRGYKWEPRSVEKIVDFCIDEGVDPKQIVIGAAFYGRAWKGVHPKENGLYQPNRGSYIGWSEYSQIRKEFESNSNYTRFWDPVGKAPYLYNAKDSIFISYDDTVSVRLKTQYAKDKKLGGIMFWELGNDTKEKGSLVNAIYEASVE